MSDLFSHAAELERLPIPDAEILYMPGLALDDEPEMLTRFLINTIHWRAENITVWGKTFPQPRLVAWFGEAGMDYSYSGIHLYPNPWTPELMKIKQKVENVTQTQFNSALLNYYRHNRDSMGFHSDDERELGPQPIIASVSLGTSRTLVFKHKHDKALKPVRLRLESGSLLVMKGETQKNWQHGIEKETKDCGPRVNLTFRQILAA